MAAGHAMTFHRMRPFRPVAITDKRNHVRWHELWEGNPAIASPQQIEHGRRSRRIVNGVGCRPYIRYPFTSEHGMQFTDWRARDHVGELYLTAAEISIGLELRDRIGAFYVLEPDVKPLATPNKKWGLDRFRSVVEAIPGVTFVRLHGGECPAFDGVLNIQTRSFRDACGILAASDGYVGTEGGFHHAAAVLRKPGVVIFGGFISPETTGYPWHTNLADTGPGSPCGTWKPCEHCARAMEGITVETVVDAVEAMVAPPLQEAACQ
jgi:hypothetical protein